MSSLPDSGAQIAVTGASGFIGRRLVVALNEAGYRTRVLMRRDPVDALWRGLQPEVVAGDLGDADALQRLVRGADAVIHLAGLIKATSRKAFMATNRDGSARVAQACHDAGVPLLQVSSIAARAPRLSD
ncbi:MAG: NAD-dependent epimerase/dehydratase family protein, partial [Sinobacteraceae bacterium]|nr:NAD-dependent epimerase/dehydratase family protein [Nevskiaceae bacterium]